jgi:hypothetical protein
VGTSPVTTGGGASNGAVNNINAVMQARTRAGAKFISP